MKSCKFEDEKESQDLTYVLFKDNWCSLCKDVIYILKKIEKLNYLPTKVVLRESCGCTDNSIFTSDFSASLRNYNRKSICIKNKEACEKKVRLKVK